MSLYLNCGKSRGDTHCFEGAKLLHSRAEEEIIFYPKLVF